MIDITRERPIPIDRIALLLGVNRRTVERWVKSGLERVKIGGRVYTSKQAVQRFATHDRMRSEPLQSSVDREEDRIERELEAAGF